VHIRDTKLYFLKDSRATTGVARERKGKWQLNIHLSIHEHQLHPTIIKLYFVLFFIFTLFLHISCVSHSLHDVFNDHKKGITYCELKENFSYLAMFC
jgi:hypothetical protein